MERRASPSFIQTADDVGIFSVIALDMPLPNDFGTIPDFQSPDDTKGFFSKRDNIGVPDIQELLQNPKARP